MFNHISSQSPYHKITGTILPNLFGYFFSNSFPIQTLQRNQNIAKLCHKKYPNKLGRIAPMNLWYGDWLEMWLNNKSTYVLSLLQKTWIVEKLIEAHWDSLKHVEPHNRFIKDIWDSLKLIETSWDWLRELLRLIEMHREWLKLIKTHWKLLKLIGNNWN